MAASDQTYRNQKALDMVFGVSCVLMLVSLVWMFWDDYNRAWKKEQRQFRNVEEAMADRTAVAKLPDPAAYRAALGDLEQAEARQKKYHQDELDQIDRDMQALRAPQVNSDAKARTVKADLDSIRSFYDLEVQRHGPNSAKALRYRKDIDELTKRLNERNTEFEKNKSQMQALLHKKDQIEKPVSLAKAKVKKLREELDLQLKNMQTKRWRFGDTFRALPVIDAFNSPERIQQYTLDELPIDYNFKYVTRFDRCTTCHLGIDRPAYDKAALYGLAYTPKELVALDEVDSRLRDLQQRVKAKEKDEDFEQSVRRLHGLALAYQGADRWATRTAAPLLTDLGVQLQAQAAAPTAGGLKALRDRVKALRKNRAIQAETKRVGSSLLEEAAEPRKVDLTDARVNQFAAHPRLDLFVDPNSPHPAEKFGCTACHGGQGSATDFFYASHTPNTPATKRLWEKEHGWKFNHDWEFPMQPRRFLESKCLKCHHQVIDLMREGNRNEAPQLVRGFNLLREYGCFGCHEIAGLKGGISVGPDLRLEPVPPLEEMTPEERAKATADPLNPPGTMRKVGPSLYRISEKTHQGWVKRWIKSPRSYRPTTKMPHFYGLSNNNPEVLKEFGQERFPDAEIESIAHYLFYESAGYLDNIDTARKADYLLIVSKFRKFYEARKDAGKLNELKQFEDLLYRKTPADPATRDEWKKNELKKLKDMETRLGLLGRAGELMDSVALNDQDKKMLREAQRRIEVRGVPKTLAQKFKESQGDSKLSERATDAEKRNGRRLFTMKGCLACHSHQAVTKKGPGSLPDLDDPSKVKNVELPGVDREKYFQDQPTFGPNLSMLREKLGTDETGTDYASKRRWLIQWILDPKFHSSRTLMPVTHLTFAEAADVAGWLLDQPVTDTADDWDKVQVPRADVETLKALARGSLEKVMSDEDINRLFDGKYGSARNKGLALDEAELVGMIYQDQTAVDSALKWYVGKKAIARLGCFGCHNLPGFDYAKPIGTPLNDWGRKDPERLAFEDIENFVKDHYQIVDSLTTKKGRPIERKSRKAKPPFERFFFEALAGHRPSREGFLYQKLNEPRSYDYSRLRAWDDRLRMPRFKFARVKRRDGESDLAFEARARVEESDARQAVMTFILGLVGEPTPAQYMNDPAPDRLAEVRGRKVIDKFNCAGCHMIEAGVFDFQLTPRTLKDFEEYQKPNDDMKEGDYGNHHNPFFTEHNAWHSPVPARADRATVHGIMKDYFGDPNAPVRPMIIATEAFGYLDDAKKAHEVRAFGTVQVPFDAKTNKVDERRMTVRSPALGGHFADLLSDYLIRLHSDPSLMRREEYKPDEEFKDNNYARASSPPLLNRQGERAQPGWLFEFLRNPQPIRPLVRLRMPRFSLSDDDARDLVNYFAARSRRTNPGIGLFYPYANVPEREENFLADRTRQYIDRYRNKHNKEFDVRLGEMKTIWERQLSDEITAAKQEVKDAQAAVATAGKDPDLKKAEENKKTAQDYLRRVQQRLKDLQATDKKAYVQKEQADWEARTAYAVDGYRLLTNRNLCLNCHQLGNLQASNPESQRGPPLHLAAERLRPEWVLRWLANPQRFVPYPSVMPPYFPVPTPGKPAGYQDVFPGTPLEQATAVRDVLMNYRKVADLPAVRAPSGPAPAGGG
jgi:mono/diheme cytochrome c family protein